MSSVSVAPLGESLMRLQAHHLQDTAVENVVAAEMTDALLSRCLWPESADALERFAAEQPRATVLQALWWMHEVYQDGGPHALALQTANRLAQADAEGAAVLGAVQSYLARVHRYSMLESPLDADHAAALTMDDRNDDVAWV